MIVLGILGALVVFGLPRLVRKDNIKQVTREFIPIIKQIRNNARLQNATYRLVIDMDENANKVWIERASGPKLIDPELAQKEKEAKENEDKENPRPPAFAQDSRIIKKNKGLKTLPDKMRFQSVETINNKEVMTSGRAYIYFSPEGLVEASTIQISDGPTNIMTLVLNPLTGQVDIVPKALSLREIKR